MPTITKSNGRSTPAVASRDKLKALLDRELDRLPEALAAMPPASMSFSN